MLKIKFSHEYEKLPIVWKGTQATLIAVYPEKVETIKNRFTAFFKKDIKFRGESGEYTDFDFEDALILIFIHHNTGQLFSTIRRSYQDKFEYYSNAIGETFVLTSTIP